ncbi:hypothetical protein C1I93_24085 [Micromonospora endophytica]|uniref:Uncharacterized protein n=1 Tax=Micromonospora endophytica TaxID=515350 RepID=A0A2W2CBR6_9ACTN|nr:hypothetical protein C1I93_24085 [Micromonospora endophytica]RIW47407.1 hypothetical protein D3H59_09875 [Micromonospora endophytica]BCJ60794.1 hypothetical protein Jiend_42160 [Micromonospora endophytica]
MRTRAGVAGFVVLVLVAVIGVVLGMRQVGDRIRLPLASRSCTVQADGTVTLNAHQMANAATIAAIGIQHELPDRAVVVALATAYQESGLRNLEGGDRDSVGLFQQRPSQGWGTPTQIRDPRYAADKFYAALKKVRGWEEMRVTDAAQKVQRSAFPEAYEKWADESEVLTRALLGNATGAVVCTFGGDPAMRGEAAATALSRGLNLDWGLTSAVTTASLTGLTVAAGDQREGWRYAHWLVAHANDHGVKRVRFGDLEWTNRGDSWTRVGDESDRTAEVVAEVFGDA